MLPEVNTILYASSLGEHTRPVFRHAIKMAKAYDAKIIMVHALETVSDFVYEMVSYYLPSGQTKDFYKNEGEQRILTKMSERVKLFYEEELANHPETAGFVSDFVVKKSNVVDLVLDTVQSHHADMIILGNHTHSGRHSHITAQIVRDSNVPVLVVPND